MADTVAQLMIHLCGTHSRIGVIMYAH